MSVRLSWRPLGDVKINDEGSLIFPSMHSLLNKGGIYRITGRRPIDSKGTHDRPARWWFYIGQTGNIQARMYKYRNPGPDQKTNIRINNALRFELERGTEVYLHVSFDMELRVGRQWMDLDTDSTTQRTLAETAALYQAYRTADPLDVDMLNKGLDDSVDREFKDAPWPY
ncbi:hypothetical protein [Actinomadura sp. 6K520]|uniref:hypothetical protein n=1 Tax=Actinomadura sp. 6K520 TaxID=2530364 RepID=UPI0014048A20|nr:hypothetical protein [Actinomadura sp. 6K520]